MPNLRRWIPIALILLAGGAASGRPVHLASRAESETDDHDSGQALSPEQALAVVGSDVNHCMRDYVLMNLQTETDEWHFGRRSPSASRFAPNSRTQARIFHCVSGGMV